MKKLFTPGISKAKRSSVASNLGILIFSLALFAFLLSTPQNANAAISANVTITSISPNPVVAGNSITINYTVTNEGNVSHSFGAGCEIRQGGSWKADVDSEMTSTISFGSDRSGSFSYTIPSGWSVATYTARCAVWSGAPGSSTWLDSYDRNFTVEEAPLNLTGRIAYHVDSNNRKLHSPTNSEDGHVFIFDFENDAIPQKITESRGIGNCMNPHFSPDGSLITFMAIATGDALQWSNMRVYVLDLAEDGILRDLGQGQDPKFSPDGNIIVFKRNGQVWISNSNDNDGTSAKSLTSGGSEKSGPNYSPVPDDGRIVYWKTYDTGSVKHGDIAWRFPNGTEETIVYSDSNNYCYYPIWRDSDTILFTISQGDDDIFIYSISLASYDPFDFNSSSDDSDAFPLGSLIGFSSNRPGGSGAGYDIYVADTVGNNSNEISDINTDLHELGGAYSPYSYARKLILIAPASGQPLDAGQKLLLEVKAYSDGGIWIGANPSVTFEGSSTYVFTDLRDDGTVGDEVAGDGIYSKTISIPPISGNNKVASLAISIDNGIENHIQSESIQLSFSSPICGPADTNEDGVVKIGEIINYITIYKNGEIGIGEIMEAISEYKNGCGS